MKYKVTLNNKTYEVEVERGEAQLIAVTEAQPIVPVAAAPVAVAAPVAAAPAPVVSTAAGTPVNSPMPGTVLNMKVAAGQSVKQGEVLLSLEAMKMENEITAPRDGTVTQIVATKGTAVQTGAPLLILA